MSILENYEIIQNTIIELEKEGFAKPEIVAISKYASDEEVIEAFKAGLRSFGENYVIAALQRIERLKDKLGKEVQWHLTGHLQKNKVKKAVGNFDLIQSVDSLELLELINQRAEVLGIIQRVLLQVNISEDKNKTGFLKENLINSLSELAKYKNIFIEGLMTITVRTKDTGTFYRELRLLREKLFEMGLGPIVDIPQSNFKLSMGMSEDYPLAIREGASIIRIGRGIFA